MPRMINHRSQNHPKLILTLIVIIGFGLIQSTIHQVKALSKSDAILVAASPTMTRTATPISFKVGRGPCNERKKIIQAWLARATGKPSMNFLCGKLSIVKDNKTGKDFLVLEPCGKGSYYIFKVRPDELHEFYQFLDVQFSSGERIYTEEYGVLSKYITNFSGYYVLENCQGCGIKPVFISTAEIVFPTSTGVTAQGDVYPTLPAFPTQAEVLPSATPTPTTKVIITPSLPSPTQAVALASPPPEQTQLAAASPAVVYLSLIDLKIEPLEVIRNQNSEIRVTIQNLGFPIDKPSWNYSGKVISKASSGEVLEEFEFSSDSSSDIQVVKNTRIQAETWEITIPVKFNQSMQNGEVEVFILPLDDLMYIYPRSVKAPITIRHELATMTPTVISTLLEEIQPTITGTITGESKTKTTVCAGLYAALFIPLVAILLHGKRIRRTF